MDTYQPFETFHSGQFFGLPENVENPLVALIPAEWDVTTSYRSGTINGPRAILEASYQLDWISPLSPLIREKLGLPFDWLPFKTMPTLGKWAQLSKDYRQLAKSLIHKRENKIPFNGDDFQLLDEVNQACQKFLEELEEIVTTCLGQNLSCIVVGGDHSVALAPIKAYSRFYPNLTILHIDAHADLRQAYQGFNYSHASVMFNVIASCANVRIVQLGVRDLSPDEYELIRSQGDRILTFFDWEMHEALLKGENFSSWIQNLVDQLTCPVYLSVDIDGLEAVYAPNTGTPVPGGLTFAQLSFLFKKLLEKNIRIVGADLVEVRPSSHDDDQWDGNVGARVLFMLSQLVAVSQRL